LKQFKFILLVSMIGLSACAQTRDPSVVSLRQDNDRSLTCDQLASEYTANTKVAALKIDKNNSDDTRDFFVGALIWPGLADFKNADGVEANAILDRNIHLRALGQDIQCNSTAWPAQPERYS